MKKIAIISFITICLKFNLLAQTQDIVNSMNANQIASINDNAEAIGNTGDAMDNHAETVNNMINVAQAMIDLNASLIALDAGECTPSFSQNDDALMPSNCDETAGCQDCYNKPVESFNINRLTLARMWCLYTNTKNFHDNAIAFGNNMSSAVPQSGLGWLKAKKMIDDAYTKFKASYDKKLIQILGYLQNNMKQIAVCEMRFGVRDWYQKFGFMYFEMMQMKYKRLD